MMEYTLFIITHSVMAGSALVIFFVGKSFWADNKKTTMENCSLENVVADAGMVEHAAVVPKQTGKIKNAILTNNNLIFE